MAPCWKGTDRSSEVTLWLLQPEWTRMDQNRQNPSPALGGCTASAFCLPPQGTPLAGSPDIGVCLIVHSKQEGPQESFRGPLPILNLA